MPLTFFAHQVPVIPLKRWRPRWFDGLALCVGSMAPDFAYPLGSWLADHSHLAVGIIVWAVPFTLVACAVMRFRVAGAVYAQLPDCGPFRLHSYRVLGTRRPAFVLTLSSAFIGAVAHVALDAFTHTDRLGSRLLGFDTYLFTIGPRDFTIAGTLQYLGHTVGSLVGLWLLWRIGRDRKLEAWYGSSAVADARDFTVTRTARVVFWSIAAVGPAAGGVWAANSDESIVFTLIVATLAAFSLAGWVVGPPSARTAQLDDTRPHEGRDAVAQRQASHHQSLP